MNRKEIVILRLRAGLLGLCSTSRTERSQSEAQYD